MKTLKPVEVSEYYINKVASGMAQYFWGYIFAPIFEILADKSITNSPQSVIYAAIKNGKIWYENGAFRTKTRFTNAVSNELEKLGAVYKYNAYYISKAQLPNELISIIDLMKTQSLSKLTQIERYLIGLLPVLEKMSVQDFITIAVREMYKKLEYDIMKSAQEYKLPIIELGIVSPNVKTSRKQQKQIESYWRESDEKTKRLRKQLESAKTAEEQDKIRTKIAEHQKETYANAPQLDIKLEEFELNKISEKIAQDYVYNMNFWVKKWEAKNIIEMRKEVADMMQKGIRIAEVEKYFEKRWKVAKDKAKFLAFNESHLASSVIQATQYKKLGCTQFKWGRSTAIEKRKLHKEYYGKIFDFDNPPIIDEKLGIRGLPKQIWNCQCQMLCVVPSVAQIMKQLDKVKNAKYSIIRNNKQCDNNAWQYRRLG